ncbi:MAG: ATP-binding protein [Pseudomonadota bacterium]
MRLWPRSLFARNALLLACAITLAAAISAAAGMSLLLNSQLNRISSITAELINTMSAAALILDDEEIERLVAEIEANENLVIRSGDERPNRGVVRSNTIQVIYVGRFRERLKYQDELDWFVDEDRVLWLRLLIGNEYYWVGAIIATSLTPLDWFVLSLVVTIAVIAIFSLLGSRAVAGPIAKLKSATDQLDLDSDLQLSRIEGPTEVAALAHSFRRMANRLKRAENERSETLAALSHDLRTPLARLRLAVEMMEGDDELKESANRQVQDIDALIGQFMDYARGTFGEEPVSFDIAFAVADIAAQYRVSFEGPGSLTFDGHQRAVRRAVINLLENAEKYGASPVSIALLRCGSDVVIEVCDQGQGFAPERAREMVKSFKRGDPDSSVSGAGLGLAIVEQAAREHKGDLTFERRKPVGFVARLRLRSLETLQTGAD